MAISICCISTASRGTSVFGGFVDGMSKNQLNRLVIVARVCRANGIFLSDTQVVHHGFWPVVGLRDWIVYIVPLVIVYFHSDGPGC